MKKQTVFPHSLLYADTSACFKYLKNCDFGFVHKILSIERVYDNQISAKQKTIDEVNISSIDHLLKYGPVYLRKEEFTQKKRIDA